MDAFIILLNELNIINYFHILLGQIYETLGTNIIVLCASDILLCSLIIIFGRHSILCGLNNILLDEFVISLSALITIAGSQGILFDQNIKYMILKS